MKRTKTHHTLIDAPFQIGFECAMLVNVGKRTEYRAYVTSIDQVTGTVMAQIFNGNRVCFKYSKARRAWMSCGPNHRDRWVFAGNIELVW